MFSRRFPVQITCIVLALSLQIPLSAMTITLPGGGVTWIAPGDDWQYFKGTQPPSDPADAWMATDFDDNSWETGPSGFGYDDDDDATVLDDMEDGYLTVYIRHTFEVSQLPGDQTLALDIDFDDGFVAYLNGQRVASDSMPDGAIDYQTEADSHEAGTPERFNLGSSSDLLVAGLNVLAIEGHNTSIDSSDFSLIPALSSQSEVLQEDDVWYVDTETVLLSGETDDADAVDVQIPGIMVDFDAEDGTWTASVTLASGQNVITATAFDGNAEAVDSGTIRIVYMPADSRIGGTLAEDTSLAGFYVITEDLIVPDGVTLTIQAGTVLMFQEDVSLKVSGALLADGTEENNIRFTHYGSGATWGRILLTGAAPSRLSHCIIEYSDCEGDHKDYYDHDEDCNPDPDAPSRDYREAVVAVACHLDILNCHFRNLPDASGGAEGDAIAIISDDPDVPGEASAVIKGCDFIGIGQGVHTRFSYVLVEDCYFTGHNGDNDDIDLYGESTPPPLIKNNIMIDPGHDDMINPTRCSAIIIGNIIAGSDDHGVVLRDKCAPIMMNNLIYDCASGGISIQNQCDALLINNTIFDCGRGIRLFDHTGRWGPPYCLFPGSGSATIINCIIWDCSPAMALTESPYEEDLGSHVTVSFSIIDGGQDNCEVSENSTLTWGLGNISEDPLFADPDSGDFHLQPGSPAINTGTADQAPGDDFDGNLRPCGGAVDMGAFESGNCTTVTETPFLRGDVNADGELDLSDAVAILLHLFSDVGEPACMKTADANDSAGIELGDAISILGYLFADSDPLPRPFPDCGLDITEDELTCEAYPPCN